MNLEESIVGTPIAPNYIHTSGVSSEAEAVRDRIQECKLDLMQSETVGRLYNDIRTELREIVATASEENWDGYGARPVNRESCLGVIELALALPNSLPTPEVVAEPDGDVSLVWCTGPRRTVVLSLRPNSKLLYSAIIGGKQDWCTEHFDGSLPDDVLDSLCKILSTQE